MTVHHNGHCLEDGEIYEYLTGSPAANQKSSIESHLSGCANCRQELAQLLRILNPETVASSEIAQESQPQEIRDMVAFVQKVSRNESKRNLFYRWGSIADRFCRLFTSRAAPATSGWTCLSNPRYRKELLLTAKRHPAGLNDISARLLESGKERLRRFLLWVISISKKANSAAQNESFRLCLTIETRTCKR